MAVDFYKAFVNFIILGLLIFGILAFAIFTQSDNDVSDKLIDDNLINNTFENLGNELGTIRDDAQAQKTLFESENPTIGFGTILLFSIVSAGKVFNSMMIGVFNLLIKLPVTVLGLDPIVTSVLSAILLLTIIIGLWIVYKLGG